MRPIALVLLTCLACGTDGSPDPDPIADAGPDATPEPRFDPARGQFAVIEGHEEFEGETFRRGRVIGTVLAAAPVSFHTEIDRQGACRYLSFEPGFCDSFCDGVCDRDSVCHPFPETQSVGQVRVRGLAVGDVVLSEPIAGSYNSAGALPEDIFDLNSSVELTATNPSMAITAGGPAALTDGISGDRLTLTDGGDAVIEWTPGGRGDRARLVLRSPNQAHGLPSTAIIECDGPDSGAFSIPQAWVERFPQSSGERICVAHDCPASQLWRYRVGSAGDFELIVASERSFMVAR